MKSLFAFLLSVLPSLLKLATVIVERAHEKDWIEAGARDAIATQATAFNKAVVKATAAAQEAAERHAKDKTDDAFSSEYWRKED